MANKPFHLIPFLFLIFLFFAPIGNALIGNPFIRFIGKAVFKKIIGSHKGNNGKEVHELKAYLAQFGYLNKTLARGDNFDENLESALKTYQKNYHIKPSGEVDNETFSKMSTPRCGVPDIINGTNYMQPRSFFDAVSNFSFFDGRPKWPPAQTHLTYRFESYVPANAKAPVARAFQQWADATHFSFSEVNQDANLVIGFYRGDHGDGAPFDGLNGTTIAHAFAPTDGRFHYDADDAWSVAPEPNFNHFETVAVHEIGHLLGLQHSALPEAIMFPNLEMGKVKNLHQDDIKGIEALYNS